MSQRIQDKGNTRDSLIRKHKNLLVLTLMHQEMAYVWELMKVLYFLWPLRLISPDIMISQSF